MKLRIDDLSGRACDGPANRCSGPINEKHPFPDKHKHKAHVSPADRKLEINRQKLSKELGSNTEASEGGCRDRMAQLTWRFGKGIASS